MQPADLDEIAAIELESPSSWKRAELEQELWRRDDLQLAAVDETSGEIVGWCCGRRVGAEAELLKISVPRTRRRSGIAFALIERLIWEFSATGVEVLYLEVRAGNAPALQFYHNHGFKMTGLRKKYYTDPEDDALVFTKTLRKY